MTINIELRELLKIIVNSLFWYSKFINILYYIALTIDLISIVVINLKDEFTTAICKMKQLCTYLDDKPIQHREAQERESKLFKSYFNEFTYVSFQQSAFIWNMNQKNRISAKTTDKSLFNCSMSKADQKL